MLYVKKPPMVTEMSREPDSIEAEKSSAENKVVSFSTRSVLKLIGSGSYVMVPGPRLALLLALKRGRPEKFVLKIAVGIVSQLLMDC